jgi:hypothetical protein
MKQRMIFFVSISLLAVLTIILVLLLTKVVSIGDAGALAISLLAFFVSILSAFKDELFPFRLLIFADKLHLVTTLPPSQSSQKTVQVLLPITFFNQGYSEGIIQTVSLLVKEERDKTKYRFIPQIEVDMTAFIQQNKGLNASNILGAFVGFLLEAKHGIKKNIVFMPDIASEKPQFTWRPGVYHFELYVRVHNEKERKYFSLTQEIHANFLEMLSRGQVDSLYFSDTIVEN